VRNAIKALTFGLMITLACKFASAEVSRCDIATLRRVGSNPSAASKQVSISGVVTVITSRTAFVVQDSSDAIYVRCASSALSIDWMRTGDEVELSGYSSQGGFAPDFNCQQIRKLGVAALPPPVKASIGDLLTGRYDCRRVVVRGVGRRVILNEEGTGRTRMEVGCVGGSLSVFFSEPPKLNTNALVDAELEIIGSCFTWFNPRGEASGVNLRAQNENAVNLIRPAPPDPFAAPEVSTLGLMPFRPDGPNLHRMRLVGTVTVSRTGRYLYLQTGERGYQVETELSGDFAPGEVIEASGFMEPGPSFASMKNAVVRSRGVGSLPESLPTTRRAVFSYKPGLPGTRDDDGRLVRMAAKLVSIDAPTSRGERRLYLEEDGGTVVATLPASNSDDVETKFRPGATLELTGVCAIELSHGWPVIYQPIVDEFTLVLHSPSFIKVLAQPPWWTVGRLRLLLGISLSLLAAALSAVVVFRRVADRRSRQLAEEILAREAEKRASHEAALEFQATLRERERVAADLHDTVEQSLTGLALQLDAAKRAQDPVVASRNLIIANQMISRSREDVRRSVWNLRAHALEGQPLREALRQIAVSLIEESGIMISVEGEGSEAALPYSSEGNLLMLAKEAISNALKHSGASHINVRVDYLPSQVRLTVSDNGRGFSLPFAPGPHEGHFGLTGMRERAARLNARFEIKSSAQQGTIVSIEVEIDPLTR